MGDRISIRFTDSMDRHGGASPVLFSHWDGMSLKQAADHYLNGLVIDAVAEGRERGQAPIFWPLDRLEPQTVMVDFIRFVTKDLDKVSSNYYLGVDENDGDNSDNGHFDIDVDYYRRMREQLIAAEPSP